MMLSISFCFRNSTCCKYTVRAFKKSGGDGTPYRHLAIGDTVSQVHHEKARGGIRKEGTACFRDRGRMDCNS